MIRRTPRAAYVVGLLIVVAVLRMAATYRVFAATADEQTHVGAGLELLQHHRYRLQRANPPGARVVLAVLPALGGMRVDKHDGAQLDSVFHGPYGGSYERRLFLSRLGNALFLILGALALFLLVRHECDEWTGVIAVFLFTFEPVILGHGGLATNDMAATAGLAVALLAFVRWLRRPAPARASLLALAWAFAVLCKFSNLAFVPAACLGIGVVRLLAGGERRRAILRGAATLLIVPLLTLSFVWAGYAFTMGTLGELQSRSAAFGARAASFIRSHPGWLLPAPDFVKGVADIILIDREGHPSYFRGETSRRGWPLYFPAAVVLKTTLVLLLFVAAGVWFARGAPQLRTLMLESALACLAILALASRSSLDLGIRYVLPVFLPLAAGAAAGVSAMLRRGRAPAIAAAILLSLHGAASVAAHPDYFPYFNFLAGRDPSRILIDSNLDWGQDVLRLRREVLRLRVDRLGWAVLSPAHPDALGFPPHHALDPSVRTTGWLAISDHVLRMDGAGFGGWRWLAGLPFQRVGMSIRLYYVPSQGDTPSAIFLPLVGTAEDVQFPLGPRWRIRQTITNAGSRAARIDSNLGPPFDLASGETKPILAPYGRPPYAILRTDRDAAEQLRIATFVERTDPAAGGFSIPFPAVRERDLAAGTIVLEDVPVSPAARLNLRAWAPRSPHATFTVELRDRGGIVARRAFTAADGFFSTGDLARELPELAGREFHSDVVVTLAADDSRLWACITATDNATNLPRLILPKVR